MPEPVCVLGGIIGYGGRLARGIKTVATYETLENLVSVYMNASYKSVSKGV